MTEDFLGKLIGSSVRAKALRLFLFNYSEQFTLEQAGKRIGVSTKLLEKEVLSLTQAGVLKKRSLPTITVAAEAGKKAKTQKKELAWYINRDFRHHEALARFVHEVSPVSHENIMNALKRTGKLATVILSGTFLGDPSRPADIIVAADTINERRLELAVRALEPLFGREIRYAAFSTPEFRYRLTIQDRLIRDTLDYPHLVLLDRTRLL